MTLDMRRDLTACFAWKQVDLGFISLTSEGVTRMVHVASLWRLCQLKAEYGRVLETKIGRV
jgi:hypothetical protein